MKGVSGLILLGLTCELLCLGLKGIQAEEPLFKAGWSLYDRQTQLPGSGLDVARRLPDSLLVEGSETVFLHGSLLVRGRDYHLDYLRGVIHFQSILAVTDTARLTYQILPLKLRLSYLHPLKTLRPDQITKEDSTQMEVRPSAATLETGGLRKSGTLVRGITIGSDRDLSVQSGLNLQVEGRLGKDVDVLALLSDQNTPLQPEGNTATLQEIDKVFIQMQSSHFAATLGDYELAFNGPRYAAYSRKLQGGNLLGRTLDDSLSLSGAVSKGQFHTNFFTGQEGNQGPYPLTSKEGLTGILVLAGSEKVFLDGVLLTRGANNDYTIEYGLGEITFMPQRLITSDSRLTVDFQYSAEAYGRDIYALQGKAQLGEKIGFRTTVVSESDARNNPLAFALTDSSRAALSSAGDDPSAAEMLQVTVVDTGQGNYVYADTTWNDSIYTIFKYAGSDSSGYLNVAFSFVGTDSGNYARTASATEFYYYWVGPQQGDYAPVVRLPLPQRQRLADTEIWYQPNRQTSLKLEVAVSDFDRNTFSALDDNDNLGLAWSAEGRWLGFEAVYADTQKFQRLGVEANVRRVEDRFTPVDRLQSVEYDRQWNLQENASAGEAVQEAALTVRPLFPWTSKVTYGYLNKQAEGVASERWRGETRLQGKRLPTLSAEADWIRSSSDPIQRYGFWTRGRSAASYTWKRWTPALHYEREHKRDDFPDSTAGFLFDLYKGGLTYQAGPLKLATNQEWRMDQKYLQSDLQDFSEAWTQNYTAGLKKWRTLTGEALYTHRVKTYAQLDSAKTLTDLAEINLGWKPYSQLVDLLLHYRLNNTRVSTIVQTPVFVGAGQGTHIKVGEQYFPDPDGEYILVAQSTGQFEPVIELEGSVSLDVDPHRLPKGKKEKVPSPWKHLASETLLNFTEKTKERDVWSIYLLDFSQFQGDSTLSGNILLREDLFLFRHRKDWSFRWRGELNNSLSNLYLSGGEESRKRLIALRVRRAFNERWSAQLDVGGDTDRRFYRSTNLSSRNILTYSGALEPVFRPTRKWEIALRVVGQQDQDRVENILALRYGLEPRVVRSFLEKGRAEVKGEWHHVATAEATLPYEIAEGDPPGDNFRWDVRLDYRISKYLTASLSYNGSKDANREALHVGRAEVKATF